MNSKIYMCLFSLVTSALLPSVSRAETFSTTAELLKSKVGIEYVFSRPMLEAMFGLGVKEDRKFGLQSDCKSQYQVKPMGVVVLKPVDFTEGNINPSKGVWLTRFQLDRCGDAKVYNALFFADTNGGQPLSKPFYAGSSNAGPRLIDDAMMSTVASALARAGIKDCKTVEVFDMRVSQPAHTVVEGEKTFNGVWNEIWTFKACGQTADAYMTFIPDADGGGTTFTSGPVKP